MSSTAPTLIDQNVPVPAPVAVPEAPAVPAPSALRLRAALAAVRDEIAALDPEQLVAINLDIPAAAIAVIGATTRLMPFRARIVAELPGVNPAILDRMETYALAAMQANAQYVGAFRPAEPIAPIAAELTDLREKLVSAATDLAKHGLVDGSRLKELSGTVGFKNLLNDVIILAGMFRDNWAALDGNTAIKLPQLDRAEQLAERLTFLVAFREQGPVDAAAVTDLRHRAFSLFINNYDQVRRAISFLRWEDGDLEQLAPSLYGGRNRKKREDSADTDDATAAPVPAPVVPAPVATQPGMPAPPATGGAPAIPPGMPGNAPFPGR